MKIHLITFADGAKSIIEAGNRLIMQATNTNWFDTINLWNLEKIKIADPYWFNQHNGFILNNPRGFGYWIWKSKIIELTLKNSDENDLIVYIDSGCEININGENTFKRYASIAFKESIFCFYLNGPNYTSEQWTKKHLINRLNKIFFISEYNPPQIEATFLIVKNVYTVNSFITEWQNLSVENNYIYSNDLRLENESTDFIEHRHDQAILSLLLHSKNYGCTIRNENYFPDLWNMNFHPFYAPIAAFRNLSGVERIKSINLI
jgi:hypothetical protein